MTDEQEERLQFLISCYRSRFGDQYYDWDKVEESMYVLIHDIEESVRNDVR